MPPPSSATYRLFRDAMLHAKRVTCAYDGYAREVCPVIIGHTGDAEMVLAYQTSGAAAKACRPEAPGNAFGSPTSARPGSAMVPGVKATATARRKAASHDVDLDINIHVHRRR